MDILKTIIERRNVNMDAVPSERTRKLLPFLETRGVILEIKRSSPSKGSIAPGLDAAVTARLYAAAGAAAISVLTEENYFGGSLRDLTAAAEAAPGCAILRKDFLLDESEIDVSYNCGADAVLLIARILDTNKLVSMARRCVSLGLSALIEIREERDIPKLKAVIKETAGAAGKIIAGVNSRDLTDFSVDPLVPLALLDELSVRTVFESGIRSNGAAAFAASSGFHGALLGEAAAKNPMLARELVSAFMDAETSEASLFWKRVALQKSTRPMVKICGLTDYSDAMRCVEYGASMLGFVFSAESPRNAPPEVVSSVRGAVISDSSAAAPFLVGVITDPSSAEAGSAFELARERLLDAVQFHGCAMPSFDDKSWNAIPRYAACGMGSAGDIAELERLFDDGQPRVLIDAKAPGIAGGAGVRVDPELVELAAKRRPLWLAGGIDPLNAAGIIERFNPELIDISSGVEESPGKKDREKLKKLLSLAGRNKH